MNVASLPEKNIYSFIFATLEIFTCWMRARVMDLLCAFPLSCLPWEEGDCGIGGGQENCRMVFGFVFHFFQTDHF